MFRGGAMASIRRRAYGSSGWSFRGIDIEFLGTGSCTPTPYRNVACVGVRMASQDWLFDCGEGTQLQVTKSNCITSSKINRICITHRHGDHVFGLPSMVQTGDSSEAALSEEDTYRDIEVIGPPGTANYLIAALGFTGAKLRSRIVVSELCDAERPLQRLSGTIHVQSIKPNRDGIWELGPAESCKDGATLFAARIRHTTPCWGFLLVEPDVPGNIDADKMQALGIPPSPLYRTLKQGGALVLKDGTVVKPEDVVTPPMRGRRIAILGDTDSAFQSAHLFRGVDALVHDCTLPPQMEDHKSRATGHSGPRIAGEFARHIGAGHLFLSHIGRRIGFLRGADMLRRAAAETMRSGNVTVANDFDVFSVNPPNEVDELGVVTKRATRANLVVADGDINELSDAPADAAAAASPHAEQQQ